MKNFFTKLAILAAVLLVSTIAFAQNIQTPLMAKIENSKGKMTFHQTNLFDYQGNLDALLPQAKPALSVGHVLELKSKPLGDLVKAKKEALTLSALGVLTGLLL